MWSIFKKVSCGQRTESIIIYQGWKGPQFPNVMKSRPIHWHEKANQDTHPPWNRKDPPKPDGLFPQDGEWGKAKHISKSYYNS